MRIETGRGDCTINYVSADNNCKDSGTSIIYKDSFQYHLKVGSSSKLHLKSSFFTEVNND